MKEIVLRIENWEYNIISDILEVKNPDIGQLATVGEIFLSGLKNE
jgi:hypothetical protein